MHKYLQSKYAYLTDVIYISKLATYSLKLLYEKMENIFHAYLTIFYNLKSNKLLMTFLNRCSGCDSLFPSLMLLEHHKEEFEHW
jgi:hypothetical protein